VAGVISGSGNITLRSTQFSTGIGMFATNGALTLQAANTFTGSLTVQGEPILVQGANGLATGAFNTLGGQAVLTLNSNGSILNATGPLQLTNGQLTIDDSATNLTNRIADGQVIRLNQGTIQFTINTAGGSSETVGQLDSSSGFNFLRMNSASATQGTTLTMASLLRENRSTLLFQGLNLGAAATNASRFIFSTAPTADLAGGGGADGSTSISILPYAVGAANTGTSVFWGLVTNGANGIRPLTASEYATLALAGATDNARDSFAGGTQAIAGKTVNAYVLNDADNSGEAALTVNLTGTLTLTSGTLMFTNVITNITNNYQATTLTGGTIDFGAREGNIFVMTPANVTVNSALTGSNGLTVSGNGQLTLGTDSPALAGVITINGTTLNVSADTRLGNADNDIVFGGGVLRFNSAFTLNALRSVSLLANSFGSFDTSGGNGVVAGAITGSGDLMKIGANTLTLSGTANTYTGRTLILNGTLQAGVANLPNTSSSVIVDSSTLAFSQAGDGTYLGSISGVGNVTINLTGGGTFTFGGTNSYGGGTSITSNGTTLSGNAANLIGYITTNANTTSTVLFNQTTNATSFASIAGSGSVIKDGGGVLTLADTSTYSGATTIRGGTLAFSSGDQLGNAAATNSLVISNGASLRLVDPQFAQAATSVDLGSTRSVAIGAGGAVIDVGTFADGYVTPVADTLTVSGVISGSAADSLTKAGTGTLVLSNTGNTYAGGTTISSGTLQLGNSGVLPNTTNVSIAGAGTLDLHGQSDTIAALTGSGVVDNTAAGNSVLTVGSGNAGGTFSGNIRNSGSGTTGLVKTGTGTETLSGSSTYTGETKVNQGALVVSGSLNGSTKVTVGDGVNPALLTAAGTLTSPAFDVKANGRLDGGGTLNGAVTVESGGTLAPSATATGLKLQTGSLTFQGGSTLELSLSHTGDYSKLTLGNGVAVSLDGSLVTNITGTLNFQDLFTVILSNAPVQGMFSNTTDQAGASTYAFTSGGTDFLINYRFNAAGFDGSAGSFESISNGSNVALLVVPEPNALGMLAGGLGLALGLQRFRRRSAMRA
jgi:fibronectin-binding autotransporter adhesin